MPKDPQEPKWLDGDLIRYLIRKSQDDPSRQKYVRQAKEFRGWYKGERFLAPMRGMDDMEIDERNATARRNVIGEVVDELSSLFLKNAPVIRRLPYIPQHIRLSDGLDSLWLMTWEESFGQEVFRSVMEDAQITGIGSGKIFWDPRKANRHYPGMVGFRQIPGTALYVDPDATNDHRGQDPKFIIQHLQKYPEELVARFGDDAAIALGWRSARGRKTQDWSQIMSMAGHTNMEEDGRFKSNGQQGSSEKVDVYEAWIFPHQMYGAELTSKNKISDKYRFGIVSTMIRDKVIKNRKNIFSETKSLLQTDEFGNQSTQSQHIGHGTHPYLFLHWRPSTDENGNRRFYDVMSMVEWMVPMQFNVNALRRNMAEICRSIANPVVAFNEDALATPANKVRYLPGQMYRVRGQYRLDEAIKILTPGQMPPQVQQFIYEDMNGIREAGGVKPGVTGLFPAGTGGTSHTPSETIGTLQEAAFAPLWRYVMQVGYALQHASLLYDGLIQQFFEPGQYIGANIHGEETFVAWTGDHRSAQFRRIPVAGATTPLYDIERQQREGSVLEMTIQALTSGDARIIQATMVFLDNLRFPWSYQYMQLLQEELFRTQQTNAGMMDMGMAALQQGAQQQALPQEGTQPGVQQAGPGIDEMARELGLSPDALMLAASQ
jgi:hypothetical protein